MFFVFIFILFFIFLFFLLAASFDGLRSLLVACHCQPFCSLANKLRSFVRSEILRLFQSICLFATFDNRKRKECHVLVNLIWPEINYGYTVTPAAAD